MSSILLVCGESVGDRLAKAAGKLPAKHTVLLVHTVPRLQAALRGFRFSVAVVDARWSEGGMQAVDALAWIQAKLSAVRLVLLTSPGNHEPALVRAAVQEFPNLATVDVAQWLQGDPADVESELLRRTA